MKGEIILLPCPFCGGDSAFDYDDDGWYWIECSRCHVSSNHAVSAMEDCKPILAESWNRRFDMSPDLEKQYANSLGEMARLCDVVCPWVLHQDSRVAISNVVPASVVTAAEEIMQYVDAVRP